jgi:hypothetical protein
MPNNLGEIHYFTKIEMELIAEAVYEHYFDDHTDDLEEEEFGKEIIALGIKVGAIDERWPE